MSDRIEQDELERRVRRALGRLPQRRAPLSLEARVLGELQRQAARPWWRRSFTHWPLPARAALVALCAALIGVTTVDGTWSMPGLGSLHDVSALSTAWAAPVMTLMASTGGLATLLERAIPPLWLHVGLYAGGMLYLVLFGLGAAAYRTLYLEPLDAGRSIHE